MVEYGNFRMSLKRLREQYENYRELDAALPPLLREAVAESIIQRFETCYDYLWKVLKRYLVEELGVADSPNRPSGSRQETRTTLPGCGGFFMGMGVLLYSVIVDAFNVVRILTLEAEDDAPVGVHGDRPIASPFAFERVEYL